MNDKEREELRSDINRMFEKVKADKKWYIFEGCAEGNRADMAYLSEIEAYIIKSFFENKICFYDEGYGGTYDMSECGPFDSKEGAVNQFIKDGEMTDYLGRPFNVLHPDDLVGEFKDMYKEEK